MDLNVERVCVQLQDREQRGLLKYGVNTIIKIYVKIAMIEYIMVKTNTI